MPPTQPGWSGADIEAAAQVDHHRLSVTLAVGVLIGAGSLAAGVAATRFALGAHAGIPALVMLLAVSAVLATLGGLAAGPLLWQLEQRYRAAGHSP